MAEDVDLVWRLAADGNLVRYDPAVEVRHDVRGSVGSWFGRKFVYGMGGADLAARHGDKVAPAVLSLPMVRGAAAVLQRRWWSTPMAWAVVALTARSLAPRLPAETGTGVLSARLAARGLAWAAVRREAGLLLRHWWPATLLAVPFSRAVRRAVLSAVVGDLAVFLRERGGVDPVTAPAGRRVDDLAYGGGLWWVGVPSSECSLSVAGPS